MLSATWQKRIEVTDAIKFTNQLILRWGYYLDGLGGPSVITRGLKSEEGGRREDLGDAIREELGQLLQDGRCKARHGRWASSRSWEMKHEGDAPLESRTECSLADTLILAQ